MTKRKQPIPSIDEWLTKRENSPEVAQRRKHSAELMLDYHQDKVRWRNPPQMATRKNLKVDQKTKDELRGKQLCNMLAQYGKTGLYNGKPVDPNRIAAARAVLPFLRPTFASIEQTIVNPEDKVSHEDILTKLKALVSAHPALIRELLDSATAKPEPNPPPKPEEPQHTVQ